MAGKAKLVGKNLHRSLKLLKATAVVLDRYKIPYILDGGTLLGVIRENRLLPWDTDMDLSVDAESIPLLKKAIWRLRLQGYRVAVRYFKNDAFPFKSGDIRVIKIKNYIAPFIKGDVQLDIFIRQQSGDMQVWAVGEKNPVLPQVPSKYFERTKLTDFEGYGYQVPEQTESFLSLRYGNWKKPVKNWNSGKDDLAIPKSPTGE